MAENKQPQNELSPLASSIVMVTDARTRVNVIEERFRALHARLSRYEGLIDDKDARLAELEKQLAAKKA